MAELQVEETDAVDTGFALTIRRGETEAPVRGDLREGTAAVIAE